MENRELQHAINVGIESHLKEENLEGNVDVLSWKNTHMGWKIFISLSAATEAIAAGYGVYYDLLPKISKFVNYIFY